MRNSTLLNPFTKPKPKKEENKLAMTLTGKVTDEKNISIPFATVFISKNGALATPLARTLTDVNGNYTLNLGTTNYIFNPPKFIPYGDSVTVKVSDVNIPNQTKKIPADLLNPNLAIFLPASLKQINFKMGLAYKPDEEEVIVFFNKTKSECEKLGGTYNETTKSCEMPKPVIAKAGFPKYILYILGGLIVIGLGYYTYKKLKK
jgi:hypothetical protein